jgi:hypothetical protein
MIGGTDINWFDISSIGLMNIFFWMWSASSIYSDVPRVFIAIVQQDLFKVWRTHPGFLSKIFYRFLSILKQTGVSGLCPVKVHKLSKTVISLLTCKTDSVRLADFASENPGAGYAGTCVMFTGAHPRPMSGVSLLRPLFPESKGRRDNGD